MKQVLGFAYSQNIERSKKHKRKNRWSTINIDTIITNTRNQARCSDAQHNQTFHECNTICKNFTKIIMMWLRLTIQIKEKRSANVFHCGFLILLLHCVNAICLVIYERKSGIENKQNFKNRFRLSDPILLAHWPTLVDGGNNYYLFKY